MATTSDEASGLRVYEVEIITRVMVVAESAIDAERVADLDRDEMVSDCGADAFAVLAVIAPESWAGSLPYGGDALDADDRRRDWTVATWIAAGARADAEAKRCAAFDARQLALPVKP